MRKKIKGGEIDVPLFIPEKIKLASLVPGKLDEIKTKYQTEYDTIESDYKKKLEEYNFKKKRDIEDKKNNIDIHKLNDENFYKRLNILGRLFNYIFGCIGSFLHKCWTFLGGMVELGKSRGILIQYILFFIVILLLIYIYFYGFSNPFNSNNNSSSTNVLNSVGNNIDNPLNIINYNNIYDENKNYLSYIIPEDYTKRLLYNLNSFTNYINYYLYNNNVLLNNAQAREKIQETKGRANNITHISYDDLEYNQSIYNLRKENGYTNSILKPKDINWYFPEDIYTNADINLLPEYLKNYKPTKGTSNYYSLNDKKIIKFSYSNNVDGIYDITDISYDTSNPETNKIQNKSADIYPFIKNKNNDLYILNYINTLPYYTIEQIKNNSNQSNIYAYYTNNFK